MTPEPLKVTPDPVHFATRIITEPRTGITVYTALCGYAGYNPKMFKQNGDKKVVTCPRCVELTGAKTT